MKQPNFILLNKIKDKTLFNELNQEQLSAVTNIDGNYLVLAGAGSGKTRIIVYRALFLLSLNIPDEEILIITFTRKAILEVRERIKALLPNARIYIETFHSLAFKFLKKYTTKNGFQILTSDILEEILEENNFFKTTKFLRKDDIFKILLNKNTNFKDFCDNKKEIEIVQNLIENFKKLKSERNLFTFDEMLEEFYTQLKNKNIPNFFKYIMVDEYQDTDLLQVKILKELTKTANLMVVGDDFQSIYSFKGAKIENILFFSEEFKDVDTILLRKNYRNSKPILELANHISKYLKYTFRKQLISHNNSTDKPTLMIFKTHNDEVEYIVEKIKTFPSNSNSAILFRNFVHMELFIKKLIDEKMDFSVVDNPFLQNCFKDIPSSPNARLSLLTIHSSKGLEWDYAFIPLLLNGIIPSKLSEKNSIHEEMRLFYVAITRAKSGLFLSYPLAFYNDMGIFKTPSSFLDKIDNKFLKIERI